MSQNHVGARENSQRRSTPAGNQREGRHVEVTVLLPTNSVGEWLNQAVASILEQDGAPNLVLLVIFDGICAPTSESWTRDPRVQLLCRKESTGLANALRDGVRSATSRYIARMDADDRSHPTRLARQFAYLEQHADVAVLGGQAKYIDRLGNTRGGESHQWSTGSVRRMLLERNVVLHPTVMARREALLQAGNYRDGMSKSEDYDLWLRMAQRGDVHVLGETVLEYRVHADQMSRGTRVLAPYTTTLLCARRNLARTLGESLMAQTWRDCKWIGAQILRRIGMRRARFDQ